MPRPRACRRPGRRRWRPRLPRAPRRPPPTSARERAFARRRGAGARPRGRRGARLHAQPPAPAARRGRARGRQARRLREAAGARRRRAPRGSWPRPPSSDRQAAVPFVYRYYPTVREARERVRAGGTARCTCVHGTYLQDWLLRPDDDNWRVDGALGGASRAFADIGSHWCDLAEFVSGHRIARLSARLLTAVPERVAPPGGAAFARGDGDGRAAGGDDRGRRDRPVRDRRRRARLGGRQPGLRRAQEPALARGRRRRGGARLRPGGPRDAVVRPPRGGDDRAPRSRGAVAGRPRARDAARRPPPGLRGLLRRLRRRRLRGDRDGRRAGRDAEFADGLRAARSPTRCSRRPPSERWVDVAGRRGGGGRDEARLPHRLHARAQLEEIAAWAGANGYEALELAAWPRSATGRSRPATSRPTRSTTPRPSACGARSTSNGLDALGARLLRQQPAPRPRRARGDHAHVRACIDAAAALGGVPVGTFIGRDPGRSVAENLREAERVFPRSSTTPASAA